MMEGGVGIKLGMISPELLKDYLEVWWTILSCAIALGRFSDFLISDWLWHHAPHFSTYQKINPDWVLYVVTYQYVRRHNKVNKYNFIILKTINVLQIHEFLTLIWPLLLSMTSWHGLYTLPLYLFVIIYSRFQWVALGWFSYCFSTLGQSEARYFSDFWKLKDKSQLGHKTENAIISTFRVYILMFTIIAILAVDFQIFPSHFGKTHGYGISVMDIGVGKVIRINCE